MNSAEKEQREALYAGLAMLGYIICEADADVIPDASRKMAKDDGESLSWTTRN